MATCEKLVVCPFFNDKMSCRPGIATLYKKQYCLEDKSNCARYRIASARLPVPPDLFPHQKDVADSLLSNQLNAA